MPDASAHLADLISLAATPVVMITATSILLSSYSAKYAAIAGQMRQVTAEFRSPHTGHERRTDLRSQARFFRRRLAAMWTASILLSLALLAFLATVMAVIFAQHTAWFDTLAACTLVGGLALIGLAVFFEILEIRLARSTAKLELADLEG
jgi:hypothetical protein